MNEALVRELAPALTSDLDACEQLVLASRRVRRVFAVVSWGCAATKWASRVLNSHPDVFCLHAGNTSLQRFGYPTCAKVDGVVYLRLIAAMASGYQLAGDVHGISRHHVPEIRAAFGDGFRCAVLVRDPLPRIRSQMALFDEFRQFDAWDYVADLAKTCGIALPSEDSHARMFVHAANMLNAIIEEQEVGPVFRTEDITSGTDALAEFIGTLTAGTISLEPDWLNRSIRQPRANGHAGRSVRELNAGDRGSAKGRAVRGMVCVLQTWVSAAALH